MKMRSHLMSLTVSGLSVASLCLSLISTGCKAPGKPLPGPEVDRPEELLAFRPLYQQNCAGCHGSEGRHGASMSLANPVYLELAGPANIERITSEGVSDTAMPPFGKHAGGMLTDQQIHVIAQGMMEAWGKTDALPDASAPAPVPLYSSGSTGDAAQGLKSFTIFCARCHGADASGYASGTKPPTGSLVDPVYLALVSDQSLRSTIIAGLPDQEMPDWRSDVAGHAMTDQEVTDTVAWLASHRSAMPGQPYQNRSAMGSKEARGDQHE